MPSSELDAFLSHTAMLLRDRPPATSAEITDFAIAYLDGRQLCFAYLRDDDTDLLEEGFDLTENEFCEWRDQLLAWRANPTFSRRAELSDWMRDAPPRESGPV